MTNTPTVRRQKVRKNNQKKKLIFLLILTAFFMFVVIFAERICPYNPNAQIFSSLESPSLSHIAGCDRMGRDLFSRILIGLKTSILSTLVLVGIITVFGTVVGVLCGHFGGVIDSVIMRVSDICLAFPGLVFALAIASLLGSGLNNAVLALAVVSWPKYARVARGQTLSLESADFISAARLSGDSDLQLIICHILPNIGGTILVTAVLDIGTMMMELAGLSFLGLGATPPTAELGSMMSGGRSMLLTHPWVIVSPGIAIFVSVSIFNLLGDAVRDYLEPRGNRS